MATVKIGRYADPEKVQYLGWIGYDTFTVFVDLQGNPTIHMK